MDFSNCSVGLSKDRSDWYEGSLRSLVSLIRAHASAHYCFVLLQGFSVSPIRNLHYIGFIGTGAWHSRGEGEMTLYQSGYENGCRLCVFRRF